MPKARRLKEGEKRKIVPPGYQVRKKLGRDKDEGVVRIELQFTLEEWDKIESKAHGKGMYPSAWIKALVRKKIALSSR